MACVWGYILTLIAFVGSFSTVRFQMCPQISCPREGKITVAAFVWLFSTVGFQMSPQMACLSRMQSCIGCMCITFLHCAFSNVSPNCFTFVAFVWFFSTVRCQMCPQNVSTRRGKVTLVAFVGLFSTVRFQMCPQSTCIRGCILTLAAFNWLSPLCTFIWASSVKLFPHSLHRKIPIAFQWLSTTDLNVKSSCHFSAPNCFECKIP